MRRAIILAAGMGWRLGGGFPPKSLFEFGGKSLLRRHVELLRACGIERIVVGVGYRHHLIEAELARHAGAGVSTVFNPSYEAGNVVTLWHLREELDCGEDVLLMDADVLYDQRMLRRLVGSEHRSCLLLDRDIEPGEEPVKACVRETRIVEFGKVIDPGIPFEYCGESIGFFKLEARAARRLRGVVDEFMGRGATDQMYEEALREMLHGGRGPALGFEDVTGLPWIEIDFPSDLDRARRDILPRLDDRQPSVAGDAA